MRAMVPPLTPGTMSADPIRKPLAMSLGASDQRVFSKLAGLAGVLGASGVPGVPGVPGLSAALDCSIGSV